MRRKLTKYYAAYWPKNSVDIYFLKYVKYLVVFSPDVLLWQLTTGSQIYRRAKFQMSYFLLRLHHKSYPRKCLYSIAFVRCISRLRHIKPNVYIYIYIYIYMCVCVCVWFGSGRSLKHVSLNNKDKFGLYNLFKML